MRWELPFLEFKRLLAWRRVSAGRVHAGRQDRTRVNSGITAGSAAAQSLSCQIKTQSCWFISSSTDLAYAPSIWLSLCALKLSGVASLCHRSWLDFRFWRANSERFNGKQRGVICCCDADGCDDGGSDSDSSVGSQKQQAPDPLLLVQRGTQRGSTVFNPRLQTLS